MSKSRKYKALLQQYVMKALKDVMSRFYPQKVQGISLGCWLLRCPYFINYNAPGSVLKSPELYTCISRV